jgi:hypothetical protein
MTLYAGNNAARIAAGNALAAVEYLLDLTPEFIETEYVDPETDEFLYRKVESTERPKSE